MSKGKARGPESYSNERLVLAMVPELLRCQGFSGVRITKDGARKLVDAERADGKAVRFWLKQGWTNARQFAAVQFGLFAGPKGQTLDDQAFIAEVASRVNGAKDAGATHALFVHMVDETITNWVALKIEDVVRAYRDQIKKWPKRARNTKSATLWFEEHRDIKDAGCIEPVIRRDISLERLAGAVLATETKDDSAGSKKITAKIERRLKQQVFRELVGDRCGWRCVVTGNVIVETLDAAHLPGRNWRLHNSAEDGVLLRVDLHRLLDAGLASIKRGKFIVDPKAQVGEYAELDGKSIAIAT